MGQTIQAPALEFVCELKVTTSESYTVGKTSHGMRKVIPITGGTFEGPRIKGIVLNGGADWQLQNNDGKRIEIEAIYSIKTDDGFFIHLRNNGLLIQTTQASKNEQLDWSKVYFRAIPKFEAPIGSKYEWLNDAIFICKARPANGYIEIQVWKVL